MMTKDSRGLLMGMLMEFKREHGEKLSYHDFCAVVDVGRMVEDSIKEDGANNE